MFCPNCGHNAGDAKFCPDCGLDLAGLRARGQSPQDVPDDRTGHSQPAAPRSRTVTLLIVAGIAVAAAAVLVVGIVASHSSSPSGSASASASAPANPDLTGTYSQLVARAEGYYKKGEPYASSGDYTTGAPWFAAAAKVLQVAWQKQPGDPRVGADFANALFFSGDIPSAIKQIDQVLKISPKDQAALLDKADFVNMAGQMDKQSTSGPTKADAEIAEAKKLYRQVIALDPSSAAAKTAAAELKKL